MKAVVWTSYGEPDVLQVRDLERPVPGIKDILVRIHASSVTAADARMRACNVPAGFWLPMRLALGLRRPRVRIPGMEFSGEVVAAGADVTRFKPGNEVYGTNALKMGTHARFVCLPENPQ